MMRTLTPSTEQVRTVLGHPAPPGSGAMVLYRCPPCTNSNLQAGPPPRKSIFAEMQKRMLAWEGPCGRVLQTWYEGVCPGCATRYVIPVPIRGEEWSKAEAELRDANGTTAQSLRIAPQPRVEGYPT